MGESGKVIEQEWTTDLDWIESDLKKLPVWKRNPVLCERVLRTVIPKWRKELSSEEHNNSWMKIRKRIVKEFNESEPFITAVMNFMQNTSDVYRIVDLGAGFGILSMLLSELLPEDRVDGIWLIDKQYPCQADAAKSHHISPQHLVRAWRIPLRIRKVDLKKGREVRQLHKYVIMDTKAIIMGIHLCKALSVHAINFYQSCDKAVLFMLKPCCLPGKRNLYAPVNGKNVPIIYRFLNGFSFRPLDLYDDGEKDDARNADTATLCHSTVKRIDDNAVILDVGNHSSSVTSIITNPHHDKNYTNERFSKWVDHLYKGCTSNKHHVRIETIETQCHHFQNLFIFCERTNELNYNSGERLFQDIKS